MTRPKPTSRVPAPMPRKARKQKKFNHHRTERSLIDGSFTEGWAYTHETRSFKTHYFIPSTARTVVSLCHVAKQYPIYVVPSEDGPRCGQCVRFLERRQRLSTIRAERDLRRKVGGRMAAFLANPKLGPRLYGCPHCGAVYEGLAPNLFPCREGGHDPVTVVELVKKDTWTRDKPP